MTTAPKTIRVNPREAPKGYRAEKEDDPLHGCLGCAFSGFGTNCNATEPVACMGDDRDDGQNVIFKRVKKARKECRFTVPLPLRIWNRPCI